MKTVAIIPSRYGSSRFPGKPLALIAGKPMIQRVYEQAGKSGHVSAVVVATDDERIADAVRGFGGEVVMTSESLRSGTDRVAEAADIMGLEPDDVVVNVQGDQPLLEPLCIQEILAPFETGLDCMATMIYRITDPDEATDPKHVKTVFDQNGFALYFSRSTVPFPEDASVDFIPYKHLGIYAYTKTFLDKFASLPTGTLERVERLEQLRALEFGLGIKVVITSHDSQEVDLRSDIRIIEEIIKANRKETI